MELPGSGSLPGGKATWWVLAAVALIVVVIVALRARSSGPAYSTLMPTPTDPNQAATDQAKEAAKGQAFGDVASVFRDAFTSVVGGARDTNVAALAGDTAVLHDVIGGQVLENGQYWDADVARYQEAQATARYDFGQVQETARTGLTTDAAVTVAGLDSSTSRYLSDNQLRAMQADAASQAARAQADHDAAIALAAEETRRQQDNNRTQLAITDSNNKTQQRTAAGNAFSQNSGRNWYDYVFAALPFIASLF